MCSLQVEARIVEEAERAEHYLDPSTESRITKVGCIHTTLAVITGALSVDVV